MGRGQYFPAQRYSQQMVSMQKKVNNLTTKQNCHYKMVLFIYLFKLVCKITGAHQKQKTNNHSELAD